MHKTAGKPLAKFMQKLFTTPKTQSLAKGLPTNYAGRSAANMVRGGQLAERVKQLANRPSLKEALKKRVLPYGVLSTIGTGAVLAAKTNIDANMKKVVDLNKANANISKQHEQLHTDRVAPLIQNSRNLVATMRAAGSPAPGESESAWRARRDSAIAAADASLDVLSIERDALGGVNYRNVPMGKIPYAGEDADTRAYDDMMMHLIPNSRQSYNYKNVNNPLVPDNFKQTGLGKFLGGLFTKGT